MRKRGKSHRTITLELGVSKTCVMNTIYKLTEAGVVRINCVVAGLERHLCMKRHICKMAKSNRKAPLPTIKTEFENSTNVKLPTMTISRRLWENGLYSYVPIKKPQLNNMHKRNRRNWCRGKKWYMEHWGKVLFSD
ncbi:hypothetical protein PR048_010828 [Dryococelus australis]|uniref:Transposase Tc1-like domain-containing protein n=1 Tax=Dryococelus australis TaxID=614101 RepID=A0ABQ9I3V0_9NEOP|nr:hypothetical protein PR048_010828 [Dryococelus australis]